MECQQLEEKQTIKKTRIVAKTPNETIYTQPGTWGPILQSRELIKNVTSHKGDHKQFLSPLLWWRFFLLFVYTHSLHCVSLGRGPDFTLTSSLESQPRRRGGAVVSFTSQVRAAASGL